jgi:hypothetical protein
MDIIRTLRRKALWIGPLPVALLIAGCAGIQPYEPRDYREEGPEKGLFTGSKGEWVIIGPKVRKTGEGETKNAVQGSEADREEKKHPKKPANGE